MVLTFNLLLPFNKPFTNISATLQKNEWINMYQGRGVSNVTHIIHVPAPGVYLIL